MMAEAPAVILHLLVEAGMPFGLDQLLEDVPHEPLLVLGEEGAGQVGLGGVPVVAHAGSQEAELRMHEVPGEADRLPLLGAERLVQHSGERLSRLGSRGRFGGTHMTAGGK